jgi:ABC-type sugar transport system permease subunit
MKIHRILGILWLALCCYSVLNLLRALLEIPPTAGAAWWVLVVDCLLYLVGIVASIFLFRGARWARWFIAVLAVWEAFGTTAYLVISKSFHIWSGFCIVLAVVSLVLLFMPKHEPVA